MFNVHFHNKSHKRKTICKIIFPAYLDSREVTSLSGAEKREVRDNRKKW
jgi:hypothetical protein